MKNAKKHFGKRVLAIVLAFMIVLSVAPMNSFVSAAEEDENNGTTSVFTVIVTDGTNPIEGAEVNLKNAGTFIDDTALTNSEGKAEFASIAALESTYEGEASEFICDYTVTADGYELTAGTFCPADEGGWSGEKIIALAKVDVPIADGDFQIIPYTGVYNGEEHPAITSVIADGFDVEYKLGDGEFNADVPVIKNAGNYAIVVKLSKSGYVTREVPVTVTIEKGVRTFAFAKTAPANLVYKNGLDFENKADSTDEPAKVTYAITEGADVATIDAVSGNLVFNSIGTVEVTATMEESDNYKASEAKYKITVDPTERDFQFETTDMGEIVYDPTTPVPENLIINKENVGDIVYSIESQKRDGVDVDDVATIDAVSGKVTINAAGTIVVKATVSAAGNYKGAESKYTLTIKRAAQDIVFEKPNVSGLAYKDTTKNLLSGGLSSGDITYEVVNQISSTSEPNVVTVAEDGTVTAVGIGSAVIKATKAGDNRYEPDDATFNVTTVKAEQKNFTLGEDKVVYYGTKEETFVATGNETTEDVVYSCEFPADVTPFAVVDEKTGKITFGDKKTGSFTLKATNPGNDFYEEAEDTCIVKIEEKDFNVKRSVQATEGENGWYTTDYVIIPAEGYVIGYSNSIADDTEWLDKIVVSKEGKTDSFGYYLKEVATGYIGKALINPDVNIDKVDPTINIEYSEENKSFLSKLFFKDKVTVTLSSVDATSGIEYFEYSLNDGEVEKVDAVSYDADKGVYYYEFDIPAQFNGKVTANATDFSGRKADEKLFNPDTNTELVVDNIAPNVTISFSEALGDGDVYAQPRTATIRVVEKNFYADDVVVTLQKRVSKLRGYQDVDLDLDFKPVEGEADTHEASFTCADDADYIIDAAYTDKSGNVYEYPDDIRFTVDTTESVVGVTFDDGNTSDYYNTNRRVKFEVNERNFKTKNIHLEVIGKSTDSAGKEQDVNLTDYEELLKEAEWTTDGSINTAYIELTDEARYSFKFYYKDFFSESNVIEEEFVIDKTKPSDLKIEYSEEKNLLEKIFFGDTVDVTISAFDSVSGLDKFVYSYDVSEGVSSVNKGEKDVTVTADKIVDGKYTFTIPAHFHGLVSFKAYDKATNASDVKNGDKVIVVDNVAPGVDVVYDNNVFENGKYYKADRNATIVINEANFFATDVELSVQRQLNNETAFTKLTDTYTFAPVDGQEDTYSAVIPFTEDADYKFDIKCADKSGNVFDDYDELEFVVDKIAPVISIAYDNNTVFNGKYFNADRTATIKVTEHNFDPKDFDFTIKGETTAKDGKINEVVPADTYINHIKDINNWEKDGDVYKTELPAFEIDARYTIEMSYKDLAGNESNTINEYFVIDKDPSIDLEISYKEPTLIEEMLFFKDEVEVTLKAYDAVSGVKEFNYDYPVEEGASDVNVGGSGNKAFAEGVYSAECSFTIPAQYRGLVSFTATDYSTNCTKKKYGENVVVVDKIAPGITASFDNLDVQNDKYYKDDRFATVTVTEANFFAKDVELIVNRQLNNETKFTRLTDTYTFTPVDGQKDTYSAVVPFTDDADYKFDIKYKDRSGNTFDDYNEVEFVVDKIDPVIKLGYQDEENVTPKNENNYNTNRTPVITVTEHNFDPSNFEFEIIGVITNKDGVEETVFTQADGYLSFIRNEANWTHKGNDVHEIVMPELTIDARYSIDRIAYTDLAGNDSNVLTDKFVIDKNKPTNLEIIYEDTTWFDNLLEAVSFGFYKEKATVTLKAVDNISGLDYFTYSYKVGHGATPVNQGKDNVVVTPDADGTYTFDIPAQFRGYVTFTATNKAGNSSTANDSKVVVVDNIAPKVNVKFDNNSVADGKYYKADRTATITVDEANFWPQDIVITVGKRLNNETEYKVTNSVREFTPVEGKPGVYTTQIVFNEDADYTLDINYKDRSGNAAVYTSNVGQDKETFEKLEFTVDKIAPKMSVAFDNNSFKNVNQFKANRTATITVVEHNFNPKDMVCAIVGKTVLGNGVDLTSKDYARYIRNIENWKSVGDKHTIDLDFDIDAQYDVVISYSDLADNEVEKNVVENFGVDKVAPSNLQIKYKEKSVLDVILEGITFGFYKAPVTVVLSAVDEISGVDFITYSYKIDDAVSKVNKGKTNVVVSAEDLVRTAYPAKAVAGKPQYERVTTEFQIPAQFRGYISFFATDKAGNKSNVKMDNKLIVVDDIAPVISVKYDKYTDNSHYTERTGVITIKEANFWADDVKVTIKRRLDTESTFSVLDYTPVFTAVPNVADTYRAVIKYNELNENAEYIFDIDYTDKSGNKAVYVNDANEKVEDYTADSFIVDVQLPVISGSYDNNNVRNNDKFKANRTLTLTIVEHNFRSEDVEAVVTAKDKSGKEVKVADYAAYLKKASSWTSDGDVRTAVIKFTQEANYTFGISYTDQAGNKNAAVNYGDSKAPSKFTIDKTKPTAAITVGNWDASKNGTKWDKFLSTITFSLWGNKAVDVKATSADELSGIDTIEHFRSDEALTLAQVKANETWTKAEGTNFSYTVKPDERFIVYVHVVDKSGNEIYLSSDGIIIDKTLPDIETIAPEITVAPQEQPINGIYSKNVKVDVKVVDPVVSTVYSGLKSVTYEIFNNVESTTEPTQKGTLFTYDITAKKQSDLVQKYEKDACITINASKNNSNDVTIKITAVDNSDNVTVSTCDVKIDKTAPVIDIKYDNNKADSKSFFNANRTATIVVTERNFVAKDVVVEITNTDGKAPKLSSWKKVKGTGNLDDTKWTATINYVTDGDYTFDIAYTDKAGLKCKSINYADGSVAPKAFTIDKTAPVVNVSYNNNTATNGNYFVAERVATVVIDEHNFNPDRVDFNITATDDAKPIALPRISGWVSKGDVRTCNIYYSADAKYDFDIDVTDKASNKSADYKADSFFVDKTDPQIEITNIQNHSANSGKVAPVIRFTDTNFDRNNVKVTLTGANRGTVTPIGAYSDIHNGVIFSFSNFAEEKEIDDIYTVNVSITDKAGRSKTEAVTFSVNRFGSVYTLSKDLEKLVKTYSSESKDIVLTETNPNQLSNISITLFKNNETIILKEGVDYRINVQGGNGNWYRYVYTVFEKNFQDDGDYSIIVHSEDSAGNVAENTLDTKNIELSFGIDKTDPIIDVKNLTDNEEYVYEVWTVNVSANDNLKLGKVVVELDGTTHEEWSGKELKAILDKGEDLSFDIPQRNEPYDVKVIAIDEAGNEHEVEIKNVLVSTDAGARFINALRNFYNNKPLFFGSIAGVVVVAGGIFFIVAKKKKKDDEEENK